MQLPFRNIFVTQSVCRKFNDVISGSTLLQQRMFLRSCVPVESWTLRYLTTPPGFSIYDGDHISEVEFVPTADKTTNIIKTLKPVTLCPLAEVCDGNVPAAYGLQDLHEECTLNLKDLQDCPGSWRRMLLTDPPRKRAKLRGTLHLKDPSRLHKLFEDVFNPNGIRLGDVVDAMLCRPNADPKNQHMVLDGTWNTDKRPKVDVSKELETYRTQGHRAQRFDVRVSLKGMVVPTQEEWEEVRQKAQES